MKNRMSCVVNSEGAVVDTHDIYNAIQIRNPNQRTEEIMGFVGTFSEALSAQGIAVSRAAFTYKYQLYYVNESVFLYIKVPLSASNPLVRQAYEFAKNPQAWGFQKMKDVLRNVCSINIRERIQWYILYVQEIKLERNIYDREWERIETAAPVLYTQFIEAVEYDFKNKSDAKIFENFSYTYQKEFAPAPASIIAKTAIEINNNDEPLTDISPVIANAVARLCQSNFFKNKASYGNQATFCLHAINELKLSNRSAFFGIFKEIQNTIRKTFADACHIHYKDNKIIFYEHDGSKERTIYVCDPLFSGDDQALVINGKIYNSIKDLQSHITDAIDDCDWYDAIVLPNIKGN